MAVVKYERVVSHQPLFLYAFIAMTGTSPERGDPIDSMSPDRKWVPHCFADDTVEIWLRYCRDKLPYIAAANCHT